MPTYRIWKKEKVQGRWVETDLGLVEACACDSALNKLIGNRQVWFASRVHNNTRYYSRKGPKIVYDVLKLPKPKKPKVIPPADPTLPPIVITFGGDFWHGPFWIEPLKNG